MMYMSQSELNLKTLYYFESKVINSFTCQMLDFFPQNVQMVTDLTAWISQRGAHSFKVSRAELPGSRQWPTAATRWQQLKGWCTKVTAGVESWQFHFGRFEVMSPDKYCCLVYPDESHHWCYFTFQLSVIQHKSIATHTCSYFLQVNFLYTSLIY